MAVVALVFFPYKETKALMFADDIQIGRLGGTNVCKTKFAELGVVLHPNPLWGQGGKYKPADLELMEEALPELRPQTSTRAFLCGGEDDLSDSLVSVTAWMPLQVIGNILILRNFGIVLSGNLEPC